MTVTIVEPRRRLLCVVIASFAFCMPACDRLLHRRSHTAVPYTTEPPASGLFNEKAQQLNSHGIRAFEAGNLPKAEKLFREALEVDVSFGPAHNNLGHIYLARHQLYLAAWEFEYAASLMPEIVEPIIGQGLAYETGERIDRAVEFYQEAYQRQPNHFVAIASLVRAKIKQDSDPTEIAFLLDELIMHDGRPQWVQWAKELRSTKYRTSCEDCFSEREWPDTTIEGPDRYEGLEEQLLPLDQGPETLEQGPETLDQGPETLGNPHHFEELPTPPGESILMPPVNVESPLDPSSSAISRDLPTRLAPVIGLEGASPESGKPDEVHFKTLRQALMEAGP